MHTERRSRRVRSLMWLLLLHRSILGNAPCTLIEAVGLGVVKLKDARRCWLWVWIIASTFFKTQAQTDFLIYAKLAFIPWLSNAGVFSLSWLALIFGRPLSFFCSLSWASSWVVRYEVLSAIYFLAEGFLNFPLALCGNPPICVKPDFLPHSNPYTTLIFVRDSFQQLLRGDISGKWEVGNTEQKADGWQLIALYC